MPRLDGLAAEARLLRTLLGACGVCLWRRDAEGAAVPIGCSPPRWVPHSFLPGGPEAGNVSLRFGDAAVADLPLALRAKLENLPAAVANGRCEQGGFIVAWKHAANVPKNTGFLLKRVAAGVGRQLEIAHRADVATDAHLQVRSLLEALPQGIVVVPRHGRRGFANAAAARLLDVRPGEVEVDHLAAQLGHFAAAALNAPEVTAYARPFLHGTMRSSTRSSIWRFAGPPQAMRVTLAPIGANGDDGWIWLLDDVSAEERAQDLVRQREERFRLFYQSLQHDAVVFMDLDGRLIEWNEPFRQLLGYADAALANKTLAELTVSAGRQEQDSRVAEALATRGYSSRHEKELLRADGRVVPVEARAFIRKDEAGNPTAKWEVLLDISERKKAEAELLLAAQAFDRATDGVILTTPDLSILTANDKFLGMSGYGRAELAGHPLQELLAGHHGPEFYAELRDTLLRDGRWQGEILQRHRDGDLFVKWLVVNALTDDHGKVTHYMAMYRDAEVVRKAETRISYLATHDDLTGLPNRKLFDDRFQQALAHALRGNGQLAFLFIDLDEFKTINDSFGHQGGDALLKEAARRIRQTAGEETTVARWGGDEFVILVDMASTADVIGLCESILDQLARPYAVADLQVRVPASIGVSMAPADGNDAGPLVRKADTALHRAKSQGKNTYRLFTDDMARKVQHQVRMESDLRRALDAGEIFLVYQPQFTLPGRQLAGCEALLRWRCNGRTISPGLFIPVAEKSSLMEEISDWVFSEASRQLKAWDLAGCRVDMLSLNTSARLFRQDDMAGWLQHRITGSGISPERVCLEITEGVLMDAARSEQVLGSLKDAGFQVSVDDFGTGFSSLSYLKRFPIDELKIDKSFVDGIDSTASDRAIIAAILTMAHSLGMRVVAEGVENVRQLEYLAAQQCDVLQGYLLSRPLLPQDFEELTARLSPGFPASRENSRAG